MLVKVVAEATIGEALVADGIDSCSIVGKEPHETR